MRMDSSLFLVAKATNKMSEPKNYKCRLCPFESKWNFVLKNHKKVHISDNTFNCAMDLNNYTCKVCGYETPLKTLLRKHLMKDHNLATSPTICNNFSEVPVEPEIVTTNSEAEYEQFCCWYCGLETFSQMFLSLHLKKLHGFLEERFERSNVKSLDSNESLDGIKKEFSCTQCFYKSHRKVNVTRHVRYHHIPEDEIKWFECALCNYRTRRSSDLKRHELVNHAPKKEGTWLKCEHCGYQTRDRGNFRKHHASKHSSENKLRCTLCNYRLELQEKLKTLLLKSETQRCECAICGFKAKTKRDLKKHNKVHVPESEIQWYYCKICEYRAKKGNAVQKHYFNKHAPDDEVRWFKCTFCDYKAKRANKVRNHYIGRHAPENEIDWFRCTVCDFKTKWKRSLRSHQTSRSHFPNEEPA